MAETPKVPVIIEGQIEYTEAGGAKKVTACVIKGEMSQPMGVDNAPPSGPPPVAKPT